MKKLLKNKIIIIVFIVCLLCMISVLSFLVLKNSKIENNVVKENDFTYNEDGSVTLGLGMVANGFNDIKTRKIIDSGSLLNPINGKIRGQDILTSNIYWWSILLKDYKKKNLIEYNKSIVDFDTQTNYGILLSKTHQEASAMPTCTSMEDVELIMSNTNQYDMEYAIIAFLDWKQIPVLTNDMIEFIKIPSQSTIYMKLNVPHVEENTPYQIFAVPSPFSNDIKLSVPPSCTLRTIVSPE